MSAAAGAAVAAGGAALAAGTFGYNRENYMWDQENRWERFTSAREYANQQAEQFRADLRSMAALTAKKTAIWCIMSSLCMALCVALYCAGRLGLHGPSPPAWIMGLWLTNNAAAFAFMALAMFLAMHAGFRAQAASTQLLTRVTRVPIPTLRELDAARRFASEFEQQDWSDIFRIPIVTNNGAPRTDPEDPSDAAGPSAAAKGACSSWIQEEFQTDRDFKQVDEQGDELDPLPPDTVPEHFRIFEQVQKEYYEHDIYARICVFYGFVHYVQSLGYYGLGHINIELRAFWTAYGCVFVIGVLQALLLRFDIVPNPNNKKQKLKNCEYLGPLALLPAAVGMSLDFWVKFDPHYVTICWIIIFVAYILQLIYSLRLLEVVMPDEAFGELEESLGDNYLPKGWNKIPSAFFHVWYFVSPPTKLQPGQHDIVREVKEGGVGAYYQVNGDDAPTTFRKPDEVKGDIFGSSSHVRPWRLVRRIVAVMPCAWVFLILGCVVDVLVGEQGLVTGPHWSRPPLTRLSKEPHELGTPLGGPLPAGAAPFTPEQMAWHEEKRHAGSYHIRRLQEAAPQSGVAFPEALNNLVAAISSADKVAAVQADAQRISWPGFFEPKLMACGRDHVAALTPRGYGAVAHVGLDRESSAESFKLSGLGDLPALLGASMGLQDGEGLLAVSRAGHLVACPGPRPQAGGVWACSASLPKLPLADGSKLTAASAAWLPGAGSERRLHAAMVVDSAPELVGLFMHEAGSWLPLGEVRIPGGAARASLSFVGGSDLLVATADQFIRHNLLNGKVVASQKNAWMEAREAQHREWQAACGFEDRVAHLHLQRAEASWAWRPELISVKLS